MKSTRIIAATLFTVLLAGCMTVGPDYRRPKVDTPEQWPGTASPDPLPAAWWKTYGDPVLDRMVGDALAYNTDLRLAIARVDEARGHWV